MYRDFPPQEVAMAKTLVHRTLKESLEDEKERLEERLTQVKLALEAIDENPGIVRVFEIIRRVV